MVWTICPKHGSNNRVSVMHSKVDMLIWMIKYIIVSYARLSYYILNSRTFLSIKVMVWQCGRFVTN